MNEAYSTTTQTRIWKQRLNISPKNIRCFTPIILTLCQYA